MSVKVRLAPYLQRKFTNGHEEIEVVGQTVRECLDNLVVQFPGIKQQLCDEQGDLLDFYLVFMNSESLYSGELDKSVKDGDELVIVSIHAGG